MCSMQADFTNFNFHCDLPHYDGGTGLAKVLYMATCVVHRIGLELFGSPRSIFWSFVTE